MTLTGHLPEGVLTWPTQPPKQIATRGAGAGRDDVLLSAMPYLGCATKCACYISIHIIRTYVHQATLVNNEDAKADIDIDIAAAVGSAKSKSTQPCTGAAAAVGARGTEHI